MFDNFLDDKKAYDALERYWVTLFDFLLSNLKKDKTNWIYPYFNTNYSNGVKMMDANPIFSAKSIETNNIIRIIQEPFEESGSLEFWNDKEKKELVIVCVLDKEIEQRIKLMIEDWLLDE